MLLALTVLMLALATARKFFFDVHAVLEQSMWPSLEGGADYVLLCKFGEPERWQIWEHELPRLPAGQLRIKRVLGLAGDFLDFRNGDLYLGRSRDALARAIRPPPVLDAMLVRLGRNCGPERFNTSGPGTLHADGELGLRIEASPPGLVAAFRGGQAIAAEGIADDAFLGHRDEPESGAGPFRQGEHSVPDVRIDVTLVELSDGATVGIRHELGGGESRAVRMGPRALEGIARLEPATETVLFSRERPRLPCRLRIETIDGVFRVVEIDEQTAAERSVWFEGPRETGRFGSYSRVSLELDAGWVRLARLDVSRDVHYFWPARLAEIGPYFVDPGHVYVVGDNVPVSEDSRVLGPVSRALLRGRAARVVWPVARSRPLP